MKKILLFILIILTLTGCEKAAETQPTGAEKNITNKTISLVAVGDNLLHMPVVNSGKRPDGSYDFAHIFAKLQPTFKEADLAVIGQETVFGGAHLGYSGYPLFNSPSDMGKTLASEGFDVVLHASNHVLDKGGAGVENTLAFWKEYPQIKVLGINESEAEKQRVDIIEVSGARLALLNYTYGTNGISVPSDKSYLVNYIDEEKIRQDVEYAEANSHFTVAFMHWGTEYSFKPDAAQKALSQKMCDWGVDLIVGSHPHVIEPVEWYTSEGGNQMLVYYSLGNFVSRQLEAKNLLGGLGSIELKYSGERVYIHDYSFVPIVTHYSKDFSDFAVYPLKEYTDALAMEHGVAARDGQVTVEKFKKIVQNVFEGYDTTCLDY